MKVKFLGTGTSQGVPVIACDCEVCSSLNLKDKRFRSSIYIVIDDNHFVIDAGPDFRIQMLKFKIKHLDAILLTHGHKDHIAGLDDVRAFNYINNKHMDVYAQDFVNKLVKNEFSYAFTILKYPGVPEINLHDLENKAFKINNVEILPVEVKHHHLPVFGYRINDFAYITDANYLSEKEKQKLLGCEVLVINALRKIKHISHFSLDEAIALVQELKPKTAYITHISHQMGLHDIVEKELPPNIHLAYDSLELELN